jgi:hypothetical protein
MSLAALRKEAAKLGVRIEADRDDYGWSYWLIDAKTGQGVWEDENFCTSHDEISSKLHNLRCERAVAA